jgi:tRNA(Ser,Leu) C12 N-acetylase TAN1
MPAHVTFAFESVAEFEDKARTITHRWTDLLAGKSFHVRVHRRTGETSAKLRSHTEEVLLNTGILQNLSNTGRPGRVKFDDPDYVLDIETVGPRAGMSIWSRDDVRRFPFLQVD